MKGYKTIGILFGTAMLTVVAGASAQGREATPESGVCFYENNNFAGDYFCSTAGETTAQVPSGTNDKISSVRIFGNATVTVFRDSNFQGQSAVINADVANLREMNLDNLISSYRVGATRRFDRGRDQRGDRRGDGNWRGGRQSNGNQSSDQDAEAVVRRGYQSVLGREPDPEGLRSWTEQVITNNWTQRDLEDHLRQSEEYRTSRRQRRR